MQREQEHRKLRTTTPDGMDQRDAGPGAAQDAGREAFHLRTDRTDPALGRSRDAPASVHGTIERHKEMARRFAESAEKPQDTPEAQIPASPTGTPQDFSPHFVAEATQPNSDAISRNNTDSHYRFSATTDAPKIETQPVVHSMTPDGMEKRSENIGDGSREAFNLRTDRADPALGRSRDAPASVHGSIERHKEMARRFAESAEKPQDTPEAQIPAQSTGTPQDFSPHFVTEAARSGSDAISRSSVDSHYRFSATTDAPKMETQPVVHSMTPDGMDQHDARPGVAYGTGREDVNLRTDRTDTAFRPLRDNPSSVRDTIARHQKQTRRFTEPAEKPQDEQTPDVPGYEPSADATPPKPEADVEQQAAPGQQQNPLRFDHIPRSKPEPTARLRFGGTPTAPAGSKRRQPPSPYAAQYIPPDGDTAPAHAATAQDTAFPQDTEQSSDADTAEEALPADEDVDTEPATDGDTAGDTQPEAPDGGQPEAEASTSGEHEPTFDDDSESAEPSPVWRDSGKRSKLRFTEEEAAATSGKPTASERKLHRAQSKAEHSAEKLEAARNKLPQKHGAKNRKTIKGTDAGSPSPRLRFEPELKSEYEHIKGAPLTRPFKAGAGAAVGLAHRKIYEAEHENVGTQSAHKAERMAERGLHSAYRFHKTSPYRKVERLERRTAKLNINASYRQALHDNPKLKSNALSRMAQKRRIKKQYAKAAREAKKTGKKVKATGNVLKKAVQAAVRAAAKHPAVLGVIAALFLLTVIIASLFSSCSNLASSIGTSLSAISYLADDADIESAELHYTEWETDLLMQISQTQTLYLGYHEYVYQLDNVGHNPYELMAFLTAAYQKFTYAGVESVLLEVFNEQYQVSYTQTTETRYNDPFDTDGDGNYEPYSYYILTVTLTSHPLTDVILPRMNTEQLAHYATLVQSKGARQYAANPFDFSWVPLVTSNYGYRVHPISGAKSYHTGIDIGVPIGTDIHAAHGGTVSTGYDASGYGYYITLTGADGLVTKYAHCDVLLAADGQTVEAGAVIAKSGNSGGSTGPHLHLEVMKNGQYLNPAFFASGF